MCVCACFPLLRGAQTEYKRRKQLAECFIGDHNVVMSTRNCPCTRSDYECADCYQPDPGDPSMCRHKDDPSCEVYDPPQQQCAASDTYLRTRGYERVDFDTCVSSDLDIWAPVETPCP